MAKIKITLIRSTIGCLENQKANAAALGLKKPGKSRIHDDNPVIRGMIDKISHLVKVENVEENL
jgi:large subunit ribosomal protein L30